jgi:16S rRNA (cytosine967-C5)-methyltransferase
LAKFKPIYDLVYLDAPCTGLGAIRRRPDVKLKKKEEDVKNLSLLQKSLLRSVSKAVAPGGRLIYSVCTITREEGPDLIDEFLQEHSDFKPVEDLPESLKDAYRLPGMLLFLPQKHNMDGFFYAVLEKTS